MLELTADMSLPCILMVSCRYTLGAAFAQKLADSPNNFQALIYM